MVSRAGWICVVLTVSLSAGRLYGQQADKTAQRKAIAYQAARAAAIAKLAERIKAIPANDQAKVADLVAGSPQIARGLAAFLAGAADKGQPRYLSDGTCQVTVTVSSRELLGKLRQLHQLHYKGDKIKSVDFEAMLIGEENSSLVASDSGSGVGEPWQVDSPASQVTSELPVAEAGHMSPKARKFWSQHCSSYGRTMAIQRARRDALTRLGIKAKRVQVAKSVTLRDYIAHSDEPDVDAQQFIRGARETRIRYHDDDLIVELELAIKLRNVYLSLTTWGRTHYKGNAVGAAQLENLVLASADESIAAIGIGIPGDDCIKNPNPTLVSVVKTAAAAPPWATGKLRSTGIAEAPQAGDKAPSPVVAYELARRRACRDLAEKVNSLSITPNTAVFEFATQNAQIEKAFLTFLQGGREIEMSRKIRADGKAEIAVELDLKRLWDLIIHHQKIQGLEVK